ncbi:MAG: cupin domain-containing protein [Chloroflexi bacterium]|nr:cupin domain-containing protein [Chloroflexota bacterium]
MPPFESNHVKAEYDLLAPDGSEIRLLHRLSGASVVHCALPVGAVSIPVRHRTVEEVWFFLAGEGQVWRKQGEREQVLDARRGLSLTIPLGTQFQFRNTGDVPLEFLITTTPPWAGEDEAVVLEVESRFAKPHHPQRWLGAKTESR